MAQRKYTGALPLKRAIDKYFEKCDADGTLYSEAGLALALGVTPHAMDQWYRGDRCEDLQETIQTAYLRIAEQIATDPRYNERNMVSLKIFLMKQEKFGGYQDKIESRSDINVNVKMGNGMDESDFA